MPDFYFHLTNKGQWLVCLQLPNELWSGFAKLKFRQQRDITDFPPFPSMRFEMAWLLWLKGWCHGSEPRWHEWKGLKAQRTQGTSQARAIAAVTPLGQHFQSRLSTQYSGPIEDGWSATVVHAPAPTCSSHDVLAGFRFLHPSYSEHQPIGAADVPTVLWQHTCPRHLLSPSGDAHWAHFLPHTLVNTPFHPQKCM